MKKIFLLMIVSLLFSCSLYDITTEENLLKRMLLTTMITEDPSVYSSYTSRTTIPISMSSLSLTLNSNQTIDNYPEYGQTTAYQVKKVFQDIYLVSTRTSYVDDFRANTIEEYYIDINNVIGNYNVISGWTVDSKFRKDFNTTFKYKGVDGNYYLSTRFETISNNTILIDDLKNVNLSSIPVGNNINDSSLYYTTGGLSTRYSSIVDYRQSIPVSAIGLSKKMNNTDYVEVVGRRFYTESTGEPVSVSAFFYELYYDSNNVIVAMTVGKYYYDIVSGVPNPKTVEGYTILTTTGETYSL